MTGADDGVAESHDDNTDEIPFEPNRCPALAAVMDLPELPAAVFVEAVELARSIPFDRDSAFARAGVGVRGHCETHPALQCLSAWWTASAPARAVLVPGSCRLAVLTPEGSYGSGSMQIPGVDAHEMRSELDKDPYAHARLGDAVYVTFLASHAHCYFNSAGFLKVLTVDGAEQESVGVPEEEFKTGGYDIAFDSLEILQTFPEYEKRVWSRLQQQARLERERAIAECTSARTRKGAGLSAVRAALARNRHCRAGVLTRRRQVLTERGPSGDRELLVLVAQPRTETRYIDVTWYGHVKRSPSRSQHDGPWVALLVPTLAFIDAPTLEAVFDLFHHWIDMKQRFLEPNVRCGPASPDERLDKVPVSLRRERVFASCMTFDSACVALADMIDQFNADFQSPIARPPQHYDEVDIRIGYAYPGPDVEEVDLRFVDFFDNGSRTTTV